MENLKGGVPLEICQLHRVPPYGGGYVPGIRTEDSKMTLEDPKNTFWDNGPEENHTLAAYGCRLVDL